MNYIVMQTFESLGTPLDAEFSKHEPAVAYAQELKDQLIDMVQGLEVVPEPDGGWDVEIEVWRRARIMSGDSKHYTAQAARFVVECAVSIVECDDHE